MSTIISILATDVVSDSRADLNTNFANLNTDKAETDQTMYIGTTAVAINRGSAALTLAGITLTTPDIGTPSAGVLTNCTGTASGLTAGDVTGLDITAGQTLTVTTGGTIGTGAYATIADYAALAGATFTGLVTIDQNADATGLYIDSEATTAGNYALKVEAGAGANPFQFAMSSTLAEGFVRMSEFGASAPMIHIKRDLAAASTDGDVLRVEQEHAADDQNAFTVIQDGTGNGIYIDQNGDGIALNIDSASTVNAPLRITSLASDPTGAHVIGDIAVVAGKLKICTVAGTPGTWTVVGTQS